MNASARAPRTRDGKPDLAGIWQASPDPVGKPEGVENEVFPRYFTNIAKDLTAEQIVLRPQAAAEFEERLKSQGKISPEVHYRPL